jgi:hypothetical protein
MQQLRLPVELRAPEVRVVAVVVVVVVDEVRQPRRVRSPLLHDWSS